MLLDNLTPKLYGHARVIRYINAVGDKTTKLKIKMVKALHYKIPHWKPLMDSALNPVRLIHCC